MVLSVSAILCGQLRSAAETRRCGFTALGSSIRRYLAAALRESKRAQSEPASKPAPCVTTASKEP